MKKKKNAINFLPVLLLLLLASWLPLLAQERTEAKKGEPQWQERSFSEERLRVLEEDARLDYPVVEVEDNAWTTFKRWFFEKLAAVFGGASRNGLLEFMLYAICIGAGVFMIFRFLDIDMGSMLKRGGTAVPLNMREGITENIHTLNFEEEIAAAVQQQDYKKAVRLVYLASLKKLTDAGHVRWEPGKTNSQYQRELKAPAFTESFASLGYYFEYAWYGDFPVNEALYQKVSHLYHQFSSQMEVRV